MNKKEFEKKLEELIIKYNKGYGSTSSSPIIAEYLTDCLIAFNKATNYRDALYGFNIKNKQL